MKDNRTVFHALRRLIALTIPLSAGRLLNIISQFIAMMMVAQLGKKELAAGYLAVSGTITVLTLTSTLFYAVGIRVRYAQHQENSALIIGHLVRNGIFMALVLAIPASFAITYLDELLFALGQDPQLIHLTHDYFLYMGLSMFPTLLLMVIGQFYIGIGKSSFTLIIEVISLPLMILASYGMVLGHFGLSQSGLGGVGLAQLLVQSIILIGSCVYMFCSPNTKPYQLFKKIIHPDWITCRSILSLGLPIGIQFGGELTVMAAANCLMGYFGVEALAALQISSQYALIVFMISLGLTQALSLTISEFYGQANTDYKLIKQYTLASFLLLLVYLVPTTLIFCTLSAELAKHYLQVVTLQPEFEYLVAAFFALSALFLFVDGIRNLLSAILRGLHDSQTATRINLAALYFVSLPISGLAVFVYKTDPVGLRVGFLSGFVAAVLLLALHLYQKISRISAAHQTAPAMAMQDVAS